VGRHGDAGTPLRVTLLGAFEVRRGDAVLTVSGARVRGLLVRLALAGGRAVGPNALVDALWPEERPADPANALQSLVSRLRRMLGGSEAVAQVDGGYRLDVASDGVDALRFERLTADGRERLRAGDPRAATALLGEAVELWRGEPAVIAEVAPAVATQLTRSSIEAAADLAEAELALGRAEAATARLTALLDDQPADERAAALLMDALAAQGRQADALALYERVRETLADSLGVDPGAALRERHLRMLRTPETVPSDEPPPSNLPAPLTSFIGRDDDLARIDTLLALGRLITVVGPGGAGKTRLAVEAARRHRHEFRDGTWLVDLAAVTEPAKAGAAVLAAVGLRGAALFESSSRMREEGSELDVLVDQLNGRESLLVVDNCEHLIDAVAHLVAALLTRCAGLRVLATSREPLAIDGEALVPLGSLALPDPEAGIDQARRTPSVRLFTDRAAAVRPGFDVDSDTLGRIVRLVRGLDGMPLALELAAARLRTLSLTELADGLSDRFRLLRTGSRTADPRHRTLAAVIDWSWHLLSEDERTVAERVSVLPGGVTAASATAVCAGTPVPAAGVPEILASLVDRSLLHLAPEPGRYRMLETLREYGIGRLAEQGTLATARGLAARHLAELVARCDPQLRGPGQLDALRVMSAEYDNALAALRHLCDDGDATGAVVLALNLTWYWQMFGRHTDAAYWLGEALALPAEGHTMDRDCAEAVLLLNRIDGLRELIPGDPELRALAERLMAYPSLPGLAAGLTALLLFFLNEREASLALLKRIIDGPDVWMAGLARLFRSQFSENEGDLGQLRVDVTAALECFGQVGDRWGLATALPMRALLRQYDGDLDGAQADLRRARALAREFGSLSLNDEVFIDLRWIDLSVRQGDIDAAFAVIAAAREKALRVASREMAILVDALEATLRVRVGELSRARELIERADVEMKDVFQLPFAGDHGRALIAAARALLCLRSGDGPGAEAALAQAYAAALETRDMPMVSMVAVAAAGLADFYGQHRDAALLLGAAARLRGTHDRTDPQIRELSRRSREALGERAFSDAYTQGWEVDGKTASTMVDPARLRPKALPAPESQARRA